MYEHNGEKYFIVDSHMHYWNAAPDNWVPGAEQYAKGWIECFHAYQGLGPPETHWSIEHFQKYSEDDLMKDVFEDGHVDVAIFQPTYLKEWYKEGFNTTERNALMGEKHPGKFIYNTQFDPRDSDAGLEELKRNVERFGSKGVKLYTAEWNNGSRGYKLSDPGAYRFLEAAQNLGIKNIHVHKGPTIWPLDKDAFDVSDIDHCATDFPELNFIVEHVGLPRIEDFCFMATQEPNVYAGLSVVIGGLMHARPNFFAKVMGELLFWVGEDKMTFGSDYGIWEPKWQVEGFVDWEMPDREEFADYPRLGTAGKKKILGLNAAKLYDIKVPDEFQLPAEAGTPGAQEGWASWSRGHEFASRARLDSARSPDPPGATKERRGSSAFRAPEATGTSPGAGDGARPRARRADHLARLRRVVRRLRGRGRAGPAAAAHLLLRAQLRLPDGRRRLRRGVGAAGRAAYRGGPGGPLRLRRDQQRRGRPGRFRPVFRRRGGRRAARAARRLPAQGGDGRHRSGVQAAARGRHGPGGIARDDSWRAAAFSRS